MGEGQEFQLGGGETSFAGIHFSLAKEKGGGYSLMP
jgi:hypothetical protein